MVGAVRRIVCFDNDRTQPFHCLSVTCHRGMFPQHLQSAHPAHLHAPFLAFVANGDADTRGNSNNAMSSSTSSSNTTTSANGSSGSGVEATQLYPATATGTSLHLSSSFVRPLAARFSRSVLLRCCYHGGAYDMINDGDDSLLLGLSYLSSVNGGTSGV